MDLEYNLPSRYFSICDNLLKFPCHTPEDSNSGICASTPVFIEEGTPPPFPNMAAYGQSPPDEGYSEDPLTMGTTVDTTAPLWLSKMTVSERTGMLDFDAELRKSPMLIRSRTCNAPDRPTAYLGPLRNSQSIASSTLYQLLPVFASGGLLENPRLPRPHILDTYGSRLERMDASRTGQEALGGIIHDGRLSSD